jgi:hypothetical protein
MDKFISWITNIFAASLVRRIIKLIKDIIQEIEIERKLKEKVNEIKKEPDADIRAKRIRDMLNS